MSKNYRRYSDGGSVMGLSQRVRRNNRRDLDRDKAVPKGPIMGVNDPITELRGREMSSRIRSRGIGGLQTGGPPRIALDAAALSPEPSREMRERYQKMQEAGREARALISPQNSDRAILSASPYPSEPSREMRERYRQMEEAAARRKRLKKYRGSGTESTTRALMKLAEDKASAVTPPQSMRYGSPGRMMASGGILRFQPGGGIPANYAAPQAYGGYGMPAQFSQRQEHLSPEVAQQYAALTQGIMRAGGRGYEDVRYKGPQLAGFTGMEAAAQAGAGAYGRGAGPQGTIQGMDTLSQAARGIGSMIPQQQALAAQYGAMAPEALQQAQAGAQGMQQLAGRAELQGQLAGAGMRQTGAAAQAEQQQLGAEAERRGRIAQTQMQGLGQQMGTAGQQALAAQQAGAQGMQQLGAGAAGQAQAREAQAAAMGQAAQQAGAAGQAQMAGLGTGAAGLGGDIRSQLGGTGGEARQVGQIGAADIRQAGLESQQLGQQALTGIGAAGGRAEEASATAAQRMRDIGGQAPQLQKGADLSDYMSQYTKGVTDPQLQQLMEFQKMQGQELGSQAAQAGAFGGSRQGVQAAEQAKAASQQAADIIGKGQQEAFQSAQAAFQQDRAAQQAAQQTGLSAEQQAAQAQQAGIGAAQQAAAQGFGAAQQGQAARQAAAQAATQAQQQGLSAQLQAQTAGGSAAQQAMGQQLQAAQQGLASGQQGRDAQMRAMQTGIAAGQYGSDAQMRAQQQAAGMQQAGAGALQQALAGQGALTAQGIGMGQQGLEAQRAAATQGAQLGMQGQQQGFGMAQQGISTGLSGLQAAQQAGQQGYGTAANLMQGQRGAMGAQMGAYGQLAGVAGQQLGGGAQQQSEQMARFDMMNRYGGQQRQLQQAGLDIAKSEHEKAMQYPERQIGWMNQQLGALPYQNIVSEASYAPQAGPMSTMMGAGIAGAGMAAGWGGNQPNQGQQLGWNSSPTGSAFAGPGVGGGQVPAWGGPNQTGVSATPNTQGGSAWGGTPNVAGAGTDMSGIVNTAGVQKPAWMTS